MLLVVVVLVVNVGMIKFMASMVIVLVVMIILMARMVIVLVTGHLFRRELGRDNASVYRQEVCLLSLVVIIFVMTLNMRTMIKMTRE